jgi:hypothetical protein
MHPLRYIPDRRESSTTAKALLLGGSLVRAAYGVGAIFAPGRMVEAEWAPDTHELDDPRLLLRAFGGHQLIVGCLSLVALGHGREVVRRAAVLSLLIDAADIGSALLELKARDQPDQSVLGGIAFSAAGAATFAAAIWMLPSGSS